MRRWSLALILMFVGCSSETLPLQPGKTDAGGILDSGVVRDAGTAQDAGAPRDAGIARDGGRPNPGEICPVPTENFRFEAVTNLPISTVEGVARIISRRPLAFQFRGAPEIIEIDWQPPAHLRLAPQSMEAWVRLEVYTPFWQETRVSMFDLTAQETAGPLLFMAWEGSSWDAGSGADVSYRYRDSDCVLGVDSKCGDQIGLDLDVQIDGRIISIPYGQVAQTDDGWVAYAGGSSRYTTPPVCPDTPNAWHRGYIVAANFPALRCRDLRPDTCISIGGCVLFGEDNNGAGYSCEPAVSACERLPSADDCGDVDGCTWTSGDCYCPAADLCACGGGPPPRCQSLCFDTPTACDQSATSQRYCRAPTTAPTACMVTQAPAVCDWRPTDCRGAPGIELCACTANGPQTFANDCRRREAGAGTYSSRACP